MGSSQLQQVISPGDSSIATVAVDGTNQDGARYTYYPAVQTNDNSQGGVCFFVFFLLKFK